MGLLWVSLNTFKNRAGNFFDLVAAAKAAEAAAAPPFLAVLVGFNSRRIIDKRLYGHGPLPYTPSPSLFLSLLTKTLSFHLAPISPVSVSVSVAVCRADIDMQDKLLTAFNVSSSQLAVP